MIVKCNCGFTGDFIPPVYCRCGRVFTLTSDGRTIETQKVESTNLQEYSRPLNESKNCMHFGERIGIAECGCQGERAIHYCQAFDNYCTPTGIGKPQFKLAPDDGSQKLVLQINEIQTCSPACPRHTTTID